MGLMDFEKHQNSLDFNVIPKKKNIVPISHVDFKNASRFIVLRTMGSRGQ
jgi:hypothetical protein